jgi:TonB family protein
VEEDNVLKPLPWFVNSDGRLPGLLSPDIKQPRPLIQPLPRLRRLRGAERGRTLIAAVIEKDGPVGVRKLLASSGDTQFDASSLEILDAWRFAPAEKSGGAVSVLVLVETSFSSVP